MRLVVAAAVATALAVTPAAGDYHGATISGMVTDAAGQPIASICVEALVEDYWEYEDYYSTITAEDGTYRLGVGAGTYRIYFYDCNDYSSYESHGDRNYLSEWYNDKPSYDLADPVVVASGEERSGIDAMLETGGSISGTVTTEAGDPLGVCVTVEGSNGYGYMYSWDGVYVVDGLRTGDYRVYFEPCEDDYYYGYPEPVWKESSSTTSYSHEPYTGSAYVSEWYNDKATYHEADLVPVVAGVETPGIDASLAIGGSISGRVVDEGGRGVRVCVDVYAANGQYVRYGLAGSDGTYLVRGLRGGDYKVQFVDCDEGNYASEWYDDQPRMGSATPVPVTLGVETLGIDAVLAREPIEDVTVSISSIEARPLRTDLGPLVPLGWSRSVTVEVASVGDLEADDAIVALYAETVTDGRVSHIATESLGDMRPGSIVTRSYDWNALGALGDVRVWAVVCSSRDGNFRNNRASVLHYSIVGGSGVGVGIRDGWMSDNLCEADYDTY